MKRAKYIQIGNTCGFYSLVYCVDSLISLEQPTEVYKNMVQEAITSEKSNVGEAFDINYLADIGKKYFSNKVELTVIPIEKEADILTHLCNASLIFPVDSKGTPHYISLLGLENGKISACTGGKICSFSPKKLYKKNRKVFTFYNWRKFRTFSKLDFLIGRRLLKLSPDEYKQFIADNDRNRNKRKKLRKLGKAPVNMRGLCIQIKKI